MKTTTTEKLRTMLRALVAEAMCLHEGRARRATQESIDHICRELGRRGED